MSKQNVFLGDKSPPDEYSYSNRNELIRLRLTSKDVLLRKIRADEFSLWILNMYLSEIPHDNTANMLFEKYQNSLKALRHEYKQKIYK